MPLFNLTEYDRFIYEKKIKNYLPKNIFDIHTHVYQKQEDHFFEEAQGRTVGWPNKVADRNPIEDLQESYSLLLPQQKVKALIFMDVTTNGDQIYRDRGNKYVEECSLSTGMPSLYVSHPSEPLEKVEKDVVKGNFKGIKSYLSFSAPYIPRKEIRIFDFFPEEQLKIANKHKWIVMLHIPRDGRLADPVNQAQMKIIAEKYSDIKLIIAHVGRAYCPEDIGKGMDVLASIPNVMVDISANCNSFVMQELIRAIGPKRIVYGSDLPILRMRARRICEKGKYINLVPPGLYGDESTDPHLREVSKKEAEKITFFFYEEIIAFLEAARETDLTDQDLEDVFYNNAIELLK